MLSEIGKEIWAEYAVAMTIMILRFVTRFRLIGWRGFDGTDLFCLIATVSALWFLIECDVHFVMKCSHYVLIDHVHYDISH